MTQSLLHGLRILAVEQFGAGPFGTLHLADLGAEVIKIEDPREGGDSARTVPPYTGDHDSLYFQAFNRNKRSLTLDLKTPEGQAVLHDLVRVSDSLFNNLRGDQPQKLGLLYDQLKHLNPRIVCCSLSGFGLTGPQAAEPGYDYLMQAATGWMSLTGDPNGPPTKSGLSTVDYAGGLAAMTGLLAGLLQAQRTGIGCDMDVSLFDTAISLLNYVAIWALNRDFQVERLADSAHPTLTPAQAFQTADGYLVVFCAKEKFWRALAAAMDAPELLADPRFATFATRLRHRAELVAELRSRFGRRTTQEWLTLLRGKVPCAPVNSMAQALADEQVLAREMITTVEHPHFGPLRQVATAIKTGSAAEPDRPGPALGADSNGLLRDLLGYSEATIAGLRQKGVI
jgi:crotonobetainyl-CoA:carnitine CoA-transferase CaiB-like acyl-CoA transferase